MKRGPSREQERRDLEDRLDRVLCALRAAHWSVPTSDFTILNAEENVCSCPGDGCVLGEGWVRHRFARMGMAIEGPLDLEGT